MKFVVLDTETTGRSFFQGDRLIEIGACKYENRELISEYHVYINPKCPVSPGALKVHGLSDQFLSDKQEFSEVFQGFLDFIADAPLVIHNAPFDLGFLDNELHEQGVAKITGNNQIIDTLPMARKLYPGQRNSLDALCRRLGVDASSRVKHGALLDAKLLAEVYLIMTSKQHTITIADKRNNKEQVQADPVGSDNFIVKIAEKELHAHEKFLQKYELDEACW